MEKKLYHTPEVEQLAFNAITSLCTSDMPNNEHQDNTGLDAPQRRVF